MNAALVESPLVEYVRKQGGKEVLVFDTDKEASAAAWAIRSKNPEGVTVEARYNKVLISLKVD